MDKSPGASRHQELMDRELQNAGVTGAGNAYEVARILGRGQVTRFILLITFNASNRNAALTRSVIRNRLCNPISRLARPGPRNPFQPIERAYGTPSVDPPGEPQRVRDGIYAVLSGLEGGSR